MKVLITGATGFVGSQTVAAAVTRNNTYGESRAQKEFGIAPRPFEETVRDTLRWMANTGRLPSRLFGRLA